MMSSSEGGSRKSDKCRQGGGGGQKTRKFCRHHLSMAPEAISATDETCWVVFRLMNHVGKNCITSCNGFSASKCSQ